LGFLVGKEVVGDRAEPGHDTAGVCRVMT
jgi:hypothetical protein